MKYAVGTRQMGRIDGYMIDTLKIPGIVLMENASRAVVDHIMLKFVPGISGWRAVVFCGCGNNGGDGFAVGRGLLAQGIRSPRHPGWGRAVAYRRRPRQF